MKDKSKKLTVVNTGKKPSEKKEEQQVVVQSSSSSSSHASGFNSNLYLLKSVWDSVFEIKTDVSGQKYIFGKLPVVTKYGVTMYADDGTLNLPSIYEGLPIDGVTLYWDNGVLKAKGGEGGGGVADSIAWANVYGKPSWVTDTKPIYNYSEINGTPDLSVFVTGTALSNTLADYATLSYLTGELKKYVTLDGAQDIKGVKNFVNGLKIANMPITKLQDDVIYIDANLVVRGGVTMYSDNEVDIPSIKDEIGFAGYNGSVGLASFDSSQFVISANGTVSVKGGSTGLDTAQLKDYLDSNKYTTETWVKEQGYASASSLSSLQTKVNNFLEGSDTDTIINKWKELEVFLSGLSESDNLADILSAKANQSLLDATNAELATKWTTDNNLINKWNTAYGWGDHSKVGYALKGYVDDTFVTIKGNENVTGVHDFVNGLKIGNIKLSKSQDGVLYLEGNLVVKGGVTMYALDEVTVDSIIDSLPLASTSQYGIAKFNPSNFVINKDGFVTIIGGSGGLDTEELADYLTTNKYATQSWVTNQKYITGITSAMVVSALGFTPYNSASFTKANIKSTLGISDWALASSKPSYNFSELSYKPTTLGGYGITDAKISNGVITLGSATITPLTTHQTIYNLTLQAGTFSANTFDPNGSALTVNIPTTTSHISEGNNLYFTNARAVSALTDTLKAYVTLSGTQTITGEKNFTGGLKVNNSPSIYYDEANKYWKLEGDLLVTGGVTMYGTDEGDLPSILDSLPIASNTALGIASFDSTYFSVDSNGMVSLTSAPSSGASSLGELLNVDASIDATASVDRILYQPRGSSVWTWRELPKDGVVGNYLPLSGGTLTGGVVIAPSASYTTAITDSCTVLKLGSDTSGMNGYNSGLGFNALQRYSSNYPLHLHAWIGLSPCINSAGSELYDLVFATNGSTTTNTPPIERMRITHDGSVKIQKLFFGNTNEINSLDGESLCINYEGAGYTFIGNNGHPTIVGSWSSTTSSQQNVLKGATLSVFGTILGYNHGKNGSGAAFILDKPGANYTGIGSDNNADTIYFGACDLSGNWVPYSQTWKFGGSIICGNVKIWDYNVIDAIGESTLHLNYYGTSDVTICKGGGTTIAFGNLLTHGGITMYSDQRKKTILNHVELSLKQIADAPLIEHYYNSDQNKTTHVGSIAQYWAGLNDWFCKLDAEGFYTMEIQNCALASAISIARHLEKYETKTDKTIRKMKQRIKELEDKLEKLEGGNV